MSLPDGRSACAVPATDGEVLTCDYWKRKPDLSLTDGPHAALLSTWRRPSMSASGPCPSWRRRLRCAGLHRHHGLARRPHRSGGPTRTRRRGGPLPCDLRRRQRMSHSPRRPGRAGRSALSISGLGEIRVRIGAPIPRCAVMDLDPVTGERNARLLRALAGYRPTNEVGEPLFGVYAEIDSRSELR